MKTRTFELIKKAISASMVEPNMEVNNCIWNQFAKEAWKTSMEMDNDDLTDLLYAITKLRGSGVQLMMNAHSLLIVAKNMLID